MPDLEPITREEMLLDGQDLEPITRKEMFIKRIYDKTQVIPEPITREEIFLKKAGDETTDVTIEQLNVSENGTYSEEGVAYSPVIVNVSAPPIPDNAYLLNEVEGLPKDIATFTDGSNLPLASLKVGIEPIQSGSGDPSPSNVRPISGHTEGNIVVSPTTDAEDGHTYTIPFKDAQGNPITVYGGSLDVVSGVLVVNRVEVDLGTLTWIESSISVTDVKEFMSLDIKGSIKKPATNTSIANIICENYKTVSAENTWRGVIGIAIRTDGNVLCDNTTHYADALAFKTAMNGVQLVYELATPLTYQLTPTQVKSLIGSNNVWGDTGEIEELEYFSKEV